MPLARPTTQQRSLHPHASPEFRPALERYPVARRREGLMANLPSEGNSGKRDRSVTREGQRQWVGIGRDDLRRRLSGAESADREVLTGFGESGRRTSL